MIGLGFDKKYIGFWKGNYVRCCWSIFRRPICHRSGLCCWKTVIHQVFSKPELPPLAPPSLHCILLLGHTWYLTWPAVVYFFQPMRCTFWPTLVFFAKFRIFGVLLPVWIVCGGVQKLTNIRHVIGLKRIQKLKVMFMTFTVASPLTKREEC